MYPADQPNPGYGTEPSRPSPMTPSATPPSHPGPGTSRYIIIVCVVLALIIAGVVAWVVIRPKHDSQETPPAPTSGESVPESTKTIDVSAGVWTEPTIVPFDLTADLKEPDTVWELGVWSGVAVLALEYTQSSPTQQRDTTVFIRAIEVDTGKILWTYDTYPDVGLLISSASSTDFTFVADDDDLVLSFGFFDEELNEVSGTFVSVRSLRTGDVETERLFGPAVASDPAEEAGWLGWSVVYFQNDVLVVEDDGNGSWFTSIPSEIQAYSKTDLNKPLWTAEWNEANRFVGNVNRGYLPGDYILVGTEYVGLNDGKPTGIKESAVGDPNHVLYYGAGDVILQDAYTVDSTDPSGAEDILGKSTSAWDPSANTPIWTYTLPQELAKSFANMCAVQGDLLYIADRFGSGPVDVYSVALSSGKQIWKITLDESDYAYDCVPLWIGDRPVIALNRQMEGLYEKAVLLDAATGDIIANLDVTAVFPIVNGLIGAVTEGEASQILSVIDPKALNGPTLWTREVSLADQAILDCWTSFRSDDSVFVAQEDGKYEFIIM